MKNTKELQKKLFNEIKGRIKLDDESLPFKDKEYEYWTKTTTKGNYSIKLRKKIGSEEVEEIWNGDLEKEKLKTEYFLCICFARNNSNFTVEVRKISQNIFFNPVINCNYMEQIFIIFFISCLFFPGLKTSPSIIFLS